MVAEAGEAVTSGATIAMVMDISHESVRVPVVEVGEAEHVTIVGWRGILLGTVGRRVQVEAEGEAEVGGADSVTVVGSRDIWRGTVARGRGRRGIDVTNATNMDTLHENVPIDSKTKN